jgi:hypothetical protein
MNDIRHVFIDCSAKDCLHHCKDKNTCGVSHYTWINIAKNGMCLDYSPLTKEEEKMIKEI